jgi:hypothetical protein
MNTRAKAPDLLPDGSPSADFVAKQNRMLAIDAIAGHVLRAEKNPAAVALGKRGGKVKSPAKAAASRENGKLGGRPKKQPEKESGR